MHIKYDIYQVLRLMILLSKTNDGLSTSDYNQLSRQFMNVNLYILNFEFKVLSMHTLQYRKTPFLVTYVFFRW